MEEKLIRFVENNGWRAYAIPVLVVITVWAFVDIFQDASADQTPDTTITATSSQSLPDVIPASSQAPATPTLAEKPSRGSGPNPANIIAPVLPSGELPPGGPYTEKGTGLFRLAGQPGPVIGEGREKTITYTVEIEEGLNPAAYGGDYAFAAMVDATLSDPRSWIADPRFAFQHIDGSDGTAPDLRIQLASLSTTHKNCGHDIDMETSCFTANGNRVLINESRWIRGAIPFAGDLGSYRQYVILHEVGHGIGFAQHEPCGKDGALAPVMMQQTLSLSNSELHTIDPYEVYPDDQAVCRYNPWPYPVLGPADSPVPPAPEGDEALPPQ